MSVAEGALWGLLGGALIEGSKFVAALRVSRKWPWDVGGASAVAPFLFAVLMRLAIGVILAIALTSAGQVSGPFGALIVGIAAPLVVESAARASAAQIGSVHSNARVEDPLSTFLTGEDSSKVQPDLSTLSQTRE